MLVLVMVIVLVMVVVVVVVVVFPSPAVELLTMVLFSAVLFPDSPSSSQ